MTTLKPRSTLPFRPTVGAALAFFAVAAAVSLKRYARARPDARRANRADVSPSADDTRDADRHFAACEAYYERHRFRYTGYRFDPRVRDAQLHFGTLPDPVAIVRVIATGGDPVDVGAIADLVDVMSCLRAKRGIVHATGRYTEAAMEYARAHRIRLVSPDELALTVAETREPVQRVLFGVKDGTGAPRGSTASVLH
jgi:hypothetical protein